MKKRILSFFLVLVMVATMVPFAAFISTAEEPAVPTADDLIVKDGLVIWLDGTDADAIDPSAGTWKSKVGSVVAQLTGGAYSDSKKAGWQMRDGILGRSQIDDVNVRSEYAIKFNIGELPTGSYTAQTISSNEGFLNADGTPTRTEWKYWMDGNTQTAISGARYGYASGEVFAFGPVRSMTYINRDHYYVKCDDAQGTNPVATADSNDLSHRWYYTGMIYGNHSTNLQGYGAIINGGDQGVAAFGPKDIFDFTITYDLQGGKTYDTASSVAITAFYNTSNAFSTTIKAGDVKDPAGHYATTLLPTNAGYSKSADVESNQKFQFMCGMPGSVFGFRMYNRVLSAKEMAQNHFADLAKYFDLDLTALATATAKGATKLFNSMAAKNFQSDKDELQGMIDSVEQKGAEPTAKQITYYDLYAQKGLQLLLLAYEGTMDSVDLTNHVWTASNGKTVTLAGGDVSRWKTFAKGGVGFNFGGETEDEINLRFDLGIANLPTGSYTIEYTSAIFGRGSETQPIVVDGNYAAETGMAMAFGPVKAEFFGVYSDTSVSAAQFWWFYSNDQENWGTAGDKYSCWGFGPRTTSFAGLANFGKIKTETIRYSQLTDTTAKIDFAGNGVSYASANIPEKCGTATFFPVNTETMLFQMFRGTPAATYSIRVYDRVISDDEYKQNHFADLVAYFALPLATIANAKPEALKAAYEEFTKYDFTADKATLQAYIDNLEQEPIVTYRKEVPYESLYVQKGLQSLYLAYNPFMDTVDLDNGTWKDLGGMDYNATIFGGKYDASTKDWAWRIDPNGGFFYRFKDIATTNAQKTNIGISFPAAALGDGNFYIESVFTPYFVSGDDGEFVYATAANGTWGVYGSGRSAFSFGCFQLCFFYPNTNGSGASSQCRIFNYNNSWGASCQVNGLVFKSPYLFGEATPKNGGQGVDGTIDPAKVTLATKPITLRFNRVLSDGTAYTKASYKVSTELASETLNNGDGTTVGARDKTEFNNFWTMANCAHPFEMFVGFPANVLAVRTYDRELTDAEKAQNHFADLCAYFELDLSNYTYAKPGSLANAIAAFGEYDFTADKAVLQGILDGIEQLPVIYVELRGAKDFIVTDGLTMLLLAENVDLTNKVWTDASGKGNNATFVGDRWALNIDGTAVGYTASTVDDHNKNTKNKVYIELPTAAFGSNFYTELTFKPNYVSVGGNIVKHVLADGQYGDYNGDGARSAFSFGGLKMCYFMPSDCSSACNSQARIFFGVNDWIGGNQPAGYQSVVPFGTWNENAEQNSLIMDPITMTVTRTQGDNDAAFVWAMPGATVRLNASVNTKVSSPFVLPEYSAWTIPFEVFNGFPADVYAIRVYDHELTANEKLQNHFADLLMVNDLSDDELFSFATFDDKLMDIMFAKCASIGIADGKDALLLAIDETVELAAALEEATTDYDKLYVQDGLVMLLDAFNGQNTSIDQNFGTWYNLVNPAVNAQIKTNGVITWTYGSKGISYDLTSEQHGSKAAHGTYIDLGSGLIDGSKDYTVEYVAMGLPTTDACAKYNTDSVTEKFGAWGGWNFQASGCRPIYNANDVAQNWGHNMAWPEAMDYAICKADKTAPVTATFVITNPSTEVSNFTVLKDGTLVQSYSSSDRKNGNEHIPQAPSQTLYNFTHIWIMQNVANTTYAVRVYDRELTAAEMTLNHFIDVCAYNEIDVTNLLSVSEEVLAMVADQCKDVPVKATVAQIATIEAAIADAKIISEALETLPESITVYDNLYVQEGLTLLLTAYGENDGSVMIDKGMWFNKVEGAYNYAKLLGIEDAAWKNNADGGIYYRMKDVATFTKYATNSGMVLPIATLSDGAFTTEFVFDPLGISGDDDVIVPHVGEEAGQSVWGAYNGQRSAFGIAGLQLCMFHYSTSSDGASMQLRPFYYTNAWEKGANNKVTWTPQPGAFADTAKGNQWREGILTMTVDRTVADGAEYKLTNFAINVSGFKFAVNNGNGVKDANKLDYAFYTLGQCANGFEAFVGFPANVYAIRAYDHVLTDAEKAQNHFVDIAAYFGLDLEAFVALDEDEKEGVYNAFAALDFSMSADTAEAVLSAAIAAQDLYGDGYIDIRPENNDVIFQAVVNINPLTYAYLTDELGATVACTVKYNDTLFNEFDLSKKLDLSYAVAIGANNLTADDAVAFTVEITVSIAGGSFTLTYTQDTDYATVGDLASYLVNDYEGTKLEKYAYANNAALLAILGEEAEVRAIDLEPTVEEPIASSETAYEGIDEKKIDSATKKMVIDGANDAAASKVGKVRLGENGASAGYSFVTAEDGTVRLVIEYVAKDYTMGYRGLFIQIDNYEGANVILSDGITGVDTDVDNHGFYVMEFTLGAGTHTVTLGLGEDTDGNTMKSVEVFSLAAQIQKD